MALFGWLYVFTDIKLPVCAIALYQLCAEWLVIEWPMYIPMYIHTYVYTYDLDLYSK